MPPTRSIRNPTPRERLADARLYLCTDARREKGDLAEFADRVLAAGVDIIQLRDKGSEGEKQFGPMEARLELAALAELRAATHRHGALLAVNDRADIALAAEADMLHLGQDDLPVHYARRILGPDVVIGRSTRSWEQVSTATTAQHTDYFCVGPVWSTPTKPGRVAVGLDLVRDTANSAPTRPWFAIGGIDRSRVPDVLAAGARRIVVVRAITHAADPAAATRELKALLAAPSTGAIRPHL